MGTDNLPSEESPVITMAMKARARGVALFCVTAKLRIKDMHLAYISCRRFVEVREINKFKRSKTIEKDDSTEHLSQSEHVGIRVVIGRQHSLVEKRDRNGYDSCSFQKND